MSQSSSIEWTDATWNPTRGCTEIAPGCAHCYAKVFAERFRGVPGHPYELGFDPRIAPDKLTEPLKWKKPRRIFVDSMSDLFHEEFDFRYIAATFGVMYACQQHTFQILTKRPERAAQFFSWLPRQVADGLECAGTLHPLAIACHCANRMAGFGTVEAPRGGLEAWPWPLSNVWIGTSIANQTDADKNIPHLLQIPAAVRFLSVEPLIGPVNLSAWLRRDDGNEEFGRRDLLGGVRGAHIDRLGGPRVAERLDASGASVGKVSAGPRDAEQATNSRAGSSPGVATLLRDDSHWPDREPSKRDHDGQQAVELGVSDAIGAGAPFDDSARSGCDEEPAGAEAHTRPGAGDTPQACERRGAEDDRGGLRHQRSDSLKDRSRPTLDWIICGGESGPGARPCNVEWIRSIVAQCKAAGVPVFVKQLGAHVTIPNNEKWPHDWPNSPEVEMSRTAHVDCDRLRLRDRKGGDWNEWPDELRIREFPEAA